MANIEQIKERFKNAKEVRCPYDDKIFNLNAKGVFKEHEGDLVFKFDEPQNGINDVFLYYERKFAEIISYNKDTPEPEPEKSEYPKVMLVSDDKIIWKQRIVFMEKNNRFLVWGNDETVEESKNTLFIINWKYAKELPKEQVRNFIVKFVVTKEEIAKWKGCDVEQLVIK